MQVVKKLYLTTNLGKCLEINKKNKCLEIRFINSI